MRFDLDEMSDAFLPEVLSVLHDGSACEDYNLLSGFVIANLATLLESSKRAVNLSLNVWTRGQLKKFLKLEKTVGKPAAEEEAEAATAETRTDPLVVEGVEAKEEEEEEEVLTMGKQSETPWKTLKGNVEFLLKRGFDLEAIRSCLFVVLHSRKILTEECGKHIKDQPEDIVDLPLVDQSTLLNLVAYHIEKRKEAPRTNKTGMPSGVGSGGGVKF